MSVKVTHIQNRRNSPEAVARRRAIGQRLQERREYLGIKRLEMATLLDITEGGYGHYETGRAEIVPSRMAKIAERLGVAASYFLGDDAAVDMDQEDRDTIRFLRNMPPTLRASARAAVQAMHDANAKLETTHGKKAE